MKKALVVVAVVLLVLWAASGLRGQAVVAPQEATVRAQLTAVAAPAARPVR